MRLILDLTDYHLKHLIIIRKFTMKFHIIAVIKRTYLEANNIGNNGHKKKKKKKKEKQRN